MIVLLQYLDALQTDQSGSNQNVYPQHIEHKDLVRTLSFAVEITSSYSPYCIISAGLYSFDACGNERSRLTSI
jgi:hypothetical protein